MLMFFYALMMVGLESSTSPCLETNPLGKPSHRWPMPWTRSLLSVPWGVPCVAVRSSPCGWAQTSQTCPSFMYGTKQPWPNKIPNVLDLKIWRQGAVCLTEANAGAPDDAISSFSPGPRNIGWSLCLWSRVRKKCVPIVWKVNRYSI